MVILSNFINLKGKSAVFHFVLEMCAVCIILYGFVARVVLCFLPFHVTNVGMITSLSLSYHICTVTVCKEKFHYCLVYSSPSLSVRRAGLSLYLAKTPCTRPAGLSVLLCIGFVVDSIT